DRMIVYGGSHSGVLADVWALSLSDEPVWSRLDDATHTAPPRYRHTAIYDPVRDRMVVFGGSDGSNVHATSAMSLSGAPEWVDLAISGDAPSSRSRHAAIYDPDDDRMIVFGGTDGGRLNDAWSLDL